MKPSLKTGFSFGLTSGVITTLGLMVGLAFRHAFAVCGDRRDSDHCRRGCHVGRLGIHISEESKSSQTETEVWESTVATFLTKFGVSLTFIVPVLLMPLTAVNASIIWGLLLLAALSFALARAQGLSPWKVIVEHVLIGLVVITITHYLGGWIGATFG